MRPTPTLAAIFLVSTSSLFAQDTAQVVDALQRLGGRPYSCKAAIAVKSEKGVKPIDAAIFQGQLSIYVGPDGSISSVSAATLPRVMTYQNGDARLFNQMHTDKTVDPRVVADLLAQSLNLKAFAKHASKFTTTKEDGKTVHVLKLDQTFFTSVVKSGDGAKPKALPPALSISAASIKMRLNDDGDIASIDYSFRVETGGKKAQAKQHTIEVKVNFEVEATSRSARAFGTQAKRLLGARSLKK